MCKKDWEIDTSDIEFDFPDEKKRYRRERAVELAIRTIDEIIGANTEGEFSKHPFSTLKLLKSY